MSFPEKLDQEDFELAVKEWKLAGYEVELSKDRAFVQVPVGENRAYIFACYGRDLGSYILRKSYDGGTLGARTLMGKLL